VLEGTVFVIAGACFTVDEFIEAGVWLNRYGEGDYVKERHDRFDAWTMEDVTRELAT
jgi:hypothetical protein